MRFAIWRNGRSFGKEFTIRGELLPNVRRLEKLVREHLEGQGFHGDFHVLHLQYDEQAANPITGDLITDEWLEAHRNNHNLVITVCIATDARPRSTIAAPLLEPILDPPIFFDQVNKAYGKGKSEVATLSCVACVLMAGLSLYAILKLKYLEQRYDALSASVAQKYSTGDTMVRNMVALQTNFDSIKDELNQKFTSREAMASLTNDVSNVGHTAETAIAAIHGDMAALQTKVDIIKDEFSEKYATRETMASLANDISNVGHAAESAIAAIDGVIFIKKRSTPCPSGSRSCKVWRWPNPVISAPYCKQGYQPEADGECVTAKGASFNYIYGCCRLGSTGQVR